MIGFISTTNQLVEVDIIGRQFVDTIETHHPLMAGIAKGGILLPKTTISIESPCESAIDLIYRGQYGS